MKKLLLFVFIFNIQFIYSQSAKLKEYKASNSVTYKIGDKVKMNLGSGINGSFVYLKMGGIMMGTTQIPATYAGSSLPIKKIKAIRHKKLGNSILFTVGGGNITNYILDIENAIAVCEVKPCKNPNEKVSEPVFNKYDQLAKLKKLFDEGVLTKEEYVLEKEKILNN